MKMEQMLEILNNLHPEVDFIVTEINNEFDVAVPAEEIVPENFNSAQALQAMVDRLLDD
jgi:hypothetical protein